MAFRKYTSSLFLILMCMSTVGYYSFLVVLKDQMQLASEAKIKSSLNEPGAHLILRIPVAIPYSSNSDGYQSAKGTFVYEGKVYQTIKRQLYNDTLYVVCLRDDQTTEANQKINDYANSFSGSDAKDGHSTDLTLFTSLAKYYVTPLVAIHAYSPEWSLCEKTTDIENLQIFCISQFIFHPPRAAS
jgi:hypothetical protein